MTQAYSAFVNDGVFTYGRTYSYVKDSSGEVPEKFIYSGMS